jgi:hypothetical protein
VKTSEFKKKKKNLWKPWKNKLLYLLKNASFKSPEQRR